MSGVLRRAFSRFARPAGLNSMNAYTQAALGLLELGLGRAERAAAHLDEAHRLLRRIRPARPESPSSITRTASRPTCAPASLEHARQALATSRMMRHERASPLPVQLEDDFDLVRSRLRAHGDRVAVRAGPHRALPRRAPAPRAAGARGARAAAVGAWSASRLSAPAPGPRAPVPSCARRAARPVRRTRRPRGADAAGARGRARGRRGATNREVAAALSVSPKTVEVHLTRIFKKARRALTHATGHTAERQAIEILWAPPALARMPAPFPSR